MPNSRNKGAQFERHVAALLRDELGIKFKRDLRQYQESERGDLIADDPAFPFLIECKSYASGTDCRTGWEKQARNAAAKVGLYPVVIWKFNNHPIKCRVPIKALAEAFSTSAATHRTADLYVQDFAYIVREIMAARKLQGAA